MRVDPWVRGFVAVCLLGLIIGTVGQVPALAQGIGTATIKVADATGARVADATVILTSGSQKRTVATGNDGTVRVDDLSPGTWVVIVVKEGFAPEEQTMSFSIGPVDVSVVLKVAGVSESVQVQGATSSNAIQLNRPATGGTFLDIPVRELPASVSVVTQQLMQDRGIQTAMEAVENTVGMTARVSVGSSPSFSSRGFAGLNDNAILRDGLRFDQASTADLRPNDTFLLDRVEVLKGPGSLLYGEAAVGATINYVSKEPSPNFGGEVLTSYGSFGTYRTGIGVTTPLGSKAEARVDVTKTGTDGYVDRTAQKLDGAAGSIRVRPTDSFSTTAYWTYTYDDIQSYYGAPMINGQVDPRLVKVNYNFQDAFARTNSWWGRVQSDLRLGNGWTIQNQVYATHDHQNRHDIRTFAYNPTTRLVDVTAYFLSTRNNYLIGDRVQVRKTFNFFSRTGRVAFAGETQRTHTNTGGLSGAGVASINFHVDPFNPQPHTDPNLPQLPTRDDFIYTEAVSGETILDVTNRLKVIGGLRAEEIRTKLTNLTVNPAVNATTTYTPVTGRAGVVFELTPATNVYGSLTTAVEPAVTNPGLATNLPDGGRFSLQPARQWEFGSKTTAFNGRMDATFAYYDMTMRDVLTSSLINGVTTQEQIGRQVSRGVELAVIGRPIARLSLAGDVALTDAKFKDFTEIVSGRNVSRDGNRPPFVPILVFNFNPSLRLGPVEVSAALRHADDEFNDTANAIRVEGYTILGGAVSYRLGDGRFRVTVRGRNLTNLLYSAGAAVSSSPTLALAPPRSMDVMFTAKF